ncbi:MULTISPECIES: serine hydrolase domain-containing protein [unclassified Microbacterium]|uniref:serine hydrolase domain-containing protein n=1 Tax=unclassified Microbacterium TaxID=2609290 RepID=UPI00214AB086|nr:MULTISPECIES: serine hydrolase domain-containing protein [unclassified Microbacterium]MCR2784721.1 beta-lactamase family protein [Microbacterium sp. zg.B96]WIM16261.1 serine hydrolase domain-containing protein [Microbacterium sp. zg-B96]
MTGHRTVGIRHAVPPAEAPAEWAAQAEAALADHLDADTIRRAPACIAAVSHRGRIIAVARQGQPRRDGVATGRRTVFRIASMSKSFLAATALSLRDEGLLDLHAPADRLVPGLAAARFDGAPAVTTLDALLSNRGGLAEDNPWGDDHLGDSREQMATLVAAGLTLSARPGTEYQYSNIGQSLVGRAIEAVTGRDVESVVRERILEPLGLTHTRPDAGDYPTGTDLAAGFRTFDDGATFTPEPYVGSGALACIGSLFSTVDDIATWMQFLGSAFGDDPAAPDVLGAASRREMQTARTLMPAGGSRFAGRDLDGAGYGYGLMIEHDRRFGRIVQHAGGLPGFSSHMRWHPATGIGVVVFGNSDAFGAGGVAGAMLGDVLGRIHAPSAVVRPWRQTIAAARRIDLLLRTGRPLSDAGALLARNVLRDVPEPVREQRLRAALAQVGPVRPDLAPLEQRVIGATDGSALRWSVPCERGALVCDVRMVGLPDPIVQAFTIAIAGPTGRKPEDETADVTDHHAVDLG